MTTKRTTQHHPVRSTIDRLAVIWKLQSIRSSSIAFKFCKIFPFFVLQLNWIYPKAIWIRRRRGRSTTANHPNNTNPSPATDIHPSKSTAANPSKWWTSNKATLWRGVRGRGTRSSSYCFRKINVPMWRSNWVRYAGDYGFTKNAKIQTSIWACLFHIIRSYYADESVNCEVFHYCQENQKHSWVCPEGFQFHQVHLICMPPSNDNACQQSSKYHIVNEFLYKPINVEEHQTRPNVTLRYSERYYPEDIYKDERQNEEDEEEEDHHAYRAREYRQRHPVTQFVCYFWLFFYHGLFFTMKIHKNMSVMKFNIRYICLLFFLFFYDLLLI